MNIKLTGKKAIISGSTSGMGYAIATGLAEAGAAVILCMWMVESHGRSCEICFSPSY